MAEEKKAAIRTTKKPEAADKNAVKKEETAADDLAAKKTKSPAKKTVKKATATTKNKATTKKTVRKTAEAPVEKPVVAAAAADDAAGKTIPAVKADTADTAASQPAVAAAPAGTAEKTVEKKPAAKKTAAKKTTAKKAEEPAKEEKKAPAKKTAAKKTTAKKTTAKKAEEPVKEEKKAPVKKTAAKKTVVKEQDEKAEKAKEAAVDAPSLKEVTIEEVKAVTAPVEEPKKPEEEPKASAEEKAAAYNAFNLDTIIEMANELGIEKTYDDYKKLLIANNDPEQIAKDLAQEATKAKSFTFEEDGYDVDLIPVLVAKVSDTIDWDAANLLPLGDRIQEACAMELGEDALANTNVYNTLFDTVREVLMIAQQENVHDLAQINEMTGADVKALVVKFMDVAYDILKSWQYNDVKYYEGFIYSVLSQFEELHQQLGTRAMMDVADLLILHGDFGLGDANYHYIIRENNIKDMIYFRFANVYRGIDRDKARAIAHEALQWVDGRYDYYQAILDILHN
ncbi:neurofilament protein [uncultured Dubosiella sp.]|uniref:neurofilament protein n=1 Tax=uncultured Dubosiella sp. TaxID=1937011 RepID=UPI0025B5A98F|nr:neurofilament protein [uncultured Dubosiella sp.]